MSHGSLLALEFCRGTDILMLVCLVYKKDRISIIRRRFDECCENSRLYKPVVKRNCDACYSACFQDGAIEFVKEGEHSNISQVKSR